IKSHVLASKASRKTRTPVVSLRPRHCALVTRLIQIKSHLGGSVCIPLHSGVTGLKQGSGDTANGRCSMEWLKSKTPIVALCSLALIALEGYAIISIKKTTEDRMIATENELRSMYESTDAKLTDMMSDLDVVTKKMGITAQELEDAQSVAQQLKKDNAQ